MKTIFENGSIFDGDRIHTSSSLVIDGGRIVSLGKTDSLSADQSGDCVRIDLGGNLLAPGFVDVQVNGGGGVLFNADPSIDGIRKIAVAHRKFGTTTILPTLISDHEDVMIRAADGVAEALRAGIAGVRGIHFEGPFLNPERRGCHPLGAVRTLDSCADIYSDKRLGCVVVTLAPEMVPINFIRKLANEGIRVSAGHTGADANKVREALQAGMSGFTHLFNAMGSISSRDPGVLGAALDDDASWCGVIADGFHVCDSNLRLAIRSKPAGKIILVTDAMPSVGSENKSFDLMGEIITAKDGRCIRSDGVVAGSDLDMASAVRNSIKFANVLPEEALRMASLYPASFLGLDGVIGRIAPGFDADLVLLDSDMQVITTWIGGKD